MVVGRDTYHQQGFRTVHGTYQGYHGEVSLLPEAAIAEDTQERVAVHTRTSYRSPLTLERIAVTKRGVAALFIHERLHNESPGEFAIMSSPRY